MPHGGIPGPKQFGRLIVKTKDTDYLAKNVPDPEKVERGRQDPEIASERSLPKPSKSDKGTP